MKGITVGDFPPALTFNSNVLTVRETANLLARSSRRPRQCRTEPVSIPSIYRPVFPPWKTASSQRNIEGGERDELRILMRT
jgi:hypothetical protein